jgi:glycosyltransferase involved in cell wall biosynthesis
MPWSLVCCGQGPEAYLLENCPGIQDFGFLQPAQLQQQLANANAVVLPSRYDPWPLALVEAAAAGVPALCSHACGSSVELIRQGYNGLIVPTDDVEALIEGLLILHNNVGHLSMWGQRSQHLAAAYSATNWAQQWRNILHHNTTIR